MRAPWRRSASALRHNRTMTDVERRDEGRGDLDALGPEQGGGPPAALPWTLVVEGDDGWSADLEHGALLPCVDDFVEFIAADGRRSLYRVTRIVHTLQPTASDRPRVRDEDAGPNATVDDGGEPRPVRELRAGLPRVFVRPEREA
jgi:hypothetical protein